MSPALDRCGRVPSCTLNLTCNTFARDFRCTTTAGTYIDNTLPLLLMDVHPGKVGGKGISPKTRTEGGGPPRRLFLGGGGLLAVLAAAGWISGKYRWGKSVLTMNSGMTDSGDLARRGETRPVLSPARFEGAVRRAYQVARELPDLFDELFYYCYCDRSFGHKSLLSCYATKHGVG